MRWLLIAITLLLSQAVEGAEITLVEKGMPDYPALILFSGKIERADGELPRNFLDIANAQLQHGATIFLESPGGALEAAIEIGRTIHAHGFTTVVADNAVCTSACGLIWLAGKERLLGPRAQVGFHAARHESGQISPQGNAMIGAYLYSIGITDMKAIVFLTMLHNPPSAMTWLSLDSAHRLKIDAKPLRGDLSMRTTRRDQIINFSDRTSR